MNGGCDSGLVGEYAAEPRTTPKVAETDISLFEEETRFWRRFWELSGTSGDGGSSRSSFCRRLQRRWSELLVLIGNLCLVVSEKSKLFLGEKERKQVNKIITQTTNDLSKNYF